MPHILSYNPSFALLILLCPGAHAFGKPCFAPALTPWRTVTRPARSPFAARKGLEARPGPAASPSAGCFACFLAVLPCLARQALRCGLMGMVWCYRYGAGPCLRYCDLTVMFTGQKRVYWWCVVGLS